MRFILKTIFLAFSATFAKLVECLVIFLGISVIIPVSSKILVFKMSEEFHSTTFPFNILNFAHHFTMTFSRRMVHLIYDDRSTTYRIAGVPWDSSTGTGPSFVYSRSISSWRWPEAAVSPSIWPHVSAKEEDRNWSEIGEWNHFISYENAFVAISEMSE